MGRVERRERERTEIRRKILDAAREHFARHGYEQVTMRAIADAIEYSPTTLYNYFEDKADLVDALCEEDFRHLLGALAPSGLPADPVARIVELGLAYAEFGLRHPNQYRFMFMTPMAHKAGDGHELSEAGQRAFGLLRSAVEEAIAAGAFRPGDPTHLAQVLWASIHGAVALLVTYRPEQFPHAPAAPDLVRLVCENGVRGLLWERR
jgi:AcrR family transcriptional regulator